MDTDKIKRKEQIYNPTRLRYLIFISLVVILILLGIGLYIVYQDADTIEQHIENEFNELQLVLAKQTALQIENEINNINSELDYIASLELPVGSSSEKVNALKTIIAKNSDKGIIDVGIRSNIGMSTPEYGYIPLITMGNPFEMNIIYDNNNTDITGDMLQCYFWKSHVTSKQDTVKLYLQYDLEKLIGYFASKLTPGHSGYAWVVDDTGKILYHPVEDYVGRMSVQVFSDILSGHDFETIILTMNNEMLQGKYGTSSYCSPMQNDKNNSIDKLIAYAPVKLDFLPEGKFWSVAVTTPVSEVLEGITDTTQSHVIAEIIIILSMFLLGGLIVIYERRMAKYFSRRVTVQQNYLSSVLQNTVDAIIMMDKDNRIIVWNTGAELTFGFKEKEMLGQTFHRIIPPELDANQELKKIHEEVITHGYIRNYRALRLTAEGKRITVDLSRTVIRDDDGEIIGSVAIIKDVTREMDVEQRMYNTEKLASIGTLAAGVAHEINNPLAVILGFTDLLKDRFKEGSSELEDLKIIEENAENAKTTVENLLGFARVSEGEQDSVDVNESLQTVIKIVESTLTHEKIELVNEINKNLPDVRGDTREFQQVIFNLINNALAAMKGSKGIIKVSGWIESRRVCVRVTDTGIGIPDRIKPRVFDPFFTTKKVGEGTGLGLSLCYGMIKKYGGSLDFFSHSAEDDPNEPSGSSFTVTMKYADSNKTEKGV